jgi:hypothetical protein
MKQVIIVAGATGNLGEKIVHALLSKSPESVIVRAIVRADTPPQKITKLESLGAVVIVLKDWNVREISEACRGASCVVSALAGLREVIIDAQKVLLDGAIKGGVKRFIPSDFSLDFTPFSNGENRNLDLRREFHTYLDQSPIAATSIFNGAFADMLTGQMPLILFKQKKILYWGDADHPMTFTTINDTANYTANAALDSTTPRFLRIAGDIKSPRELKEIMDTLSGEQYRLFRAGGLGLLTGLIKAVRFFSPGKTQLYPAWQGMQYMRNMIDERAKPGKLDNDRYPGIHWTKTKDVLQTFLKSTV